MCYTCGEEGHYSRSCPHRNFNSFSNAGKLSRDDYSNSYRTDRPQCDYCKARGHFADRCFKRRAEKAELALEKIRKERTNYFQKNWTFKLEQLPSARCNDEQEHFTRAPNGRAVLPINLLAAGVVDISTTQEAQNI